MESEIPSMAKSTTTLNGSAAEETIANLVGQVYAIAPPAERRRLLEHLLKPLGVLSVVAVANGIFATMRFSSGLSAPYIGLEDAQRVQPDDVVTLVSYVQQVSLHAVDGLADLLIASPMASGSAAAALLLSLLVKRACNRRAEDRLE